MAGVQNTSVTGSVFNIERYAVHDGPGIRTLVFLKGCPLTCLWCCNPEGQKLRSELLLFPENCIGCGRCVSACPREAVKHREGEGYVTDSERCDACFACVDVCHAKARRHYGKIMSVDEVVSLAAKDQAFYDQSGGGVTLSGGEPIFQADFCREVLAACGRAGIHTAVETTGFAPSDVLLSMMTVTDVFLFDIKHMDPAQHKRITGVDNVLILKNLDMLLGRGADVILRIPLIPGLNDSPENIAAVCEHAKARRISKINVLPYHSLGAGKYDRLGLPYALDGLEPHTPNELGRLKELFEREKISCTMY